MEHERWQLIEQLYHAALEQEPDDRKAFLRETSPDDDVRREVESLLRFDAAPGSMLDVPAWERKLRPGDRLGPYEILERIGRGGMGEVWKARDGRLGRIVAIKSPASRFSDRFEREARAISALNHPHICTLYDVGPDYLVIEYVEGTQVRGPLPLAKVIEYAKQILEALEAAHKKGIVHRDLKPANILVTRTGVKLLDFGLAKWVRAQTAAAGMGGLTIEGTIVGTPESIAPEQVQGKSVDTRADIFAFGCILYEMLTGKRAFDDATTVASMRVVHARPMPSIPELVPANLNPVLWKCLEEDPDDRWQNAGDLKAAIDLAQSSQPTAKPSRRTWIAGATVGIGSALAGGGAVAWLRRQPEDVSLRVEIDPPRGGRFAIGTVNTSFALSPDSRAAAFTAIVDGKTGLWIRQ